MQMKSLIGNYLSLNVGYSQDQIIRFKGASGGVATSLLINALESKLVDGVVVVGMDENKPWEPKVKIAKTKAELIEAQGSKYTLIPMVDILKIIEQNKDLKLAMTALPCHTQVIRNLQRSGKYDHVKLIVGTFCGYNQPYEATEFLIKKSGIKKEDIISLEYRGGPYPGGFLVKSKNKEIYFPKHYYDFINLMFVPQGCLNCKDYTNELADISVGDAWGYDNHSLIILRTNIGEELARSSSIEVKKINEQELMNMHHHNIKHKKEGDTFGRKVAMRILKRGGKHVPIKLLGFMAKMRRISKKKYIKEMD